MQINHKRGRHLETMDVISALLLTALCLLIIVPFYTSLVAAFTTNASYIQQPVQLFPQSFTLDNFSYVLERMNIAIGYRNTLLIVLVGTALSMSISLAYAYALSLKAYPGKKLAFLFLLLTMYFSGGLIPTYLLIRDLKLINSPFAIVFICGVSPFNIIIMKNSIEQLPASLDEAARLDGAGEWQIFSRITIPLIKPTVVTFSLFTAVGYWNEWYWSMIVLTKPAVKTLQIMLRTIVTTVETLEMDSASAAEYGEVFTQGLKMAAVVITMLPIMLLYPFLQKHFAKGILVGAVKM